MVAAACSDNDNKLCLLSTTDGKNRIPRTVGISVRSFIFILLSHTFRLTWWLPAITMKRLLHPIFLFLGNSERLRPSSCNAAMGEYRKKKTNQKTFRHPHPACLLYSTQRTRKKIRKFSSWWIVTLHWKRHCRRRCFGKLCAENFLLRIRFIMTTEWKVFVAHTHIE